MVYGFGGFSPWGVSSSSETTWQKGLDKERLLIPWHLGRTERKEDPGRESHPPRTHAQ